MKNLLLLLSVLTICILTACNNQESQTIDLDKIGTATRTNKSVELGTGWHYSLRYNSLESTNEDLTYLLSQQTKGDAILVTITFPENILIENPKTFELQRNHDMLEEGGILNKRFQINGKSFTGTLVGKLGDSNKKILVATYKQGEITGKPKIWSDLGRVHNELEKATSTDEPINNVEILDVETTRKPIIYLYPEQATKIHVELDYNGQLTTTYPKYDESKGWTVEAQPDGTLIDPATQKEYYGLYWEGLDNQPYDLSTGFVVKGEATADFLDEKLAQLGLTRREANEFIVYWLPELEQNEYNFIHFAQEEYRELAKLHITPKPETIIRVFMVYKPLRHKSQVEEQKLPAVERKGFTAVEWGGTMSKKGKLNLVK
ncbi:MAG: hypothetical protein GY810_12125 [Aureispira sp.]|nr:hypothetical protein [Aureispira sp.]